MNHHINSICFYSQAFLLSRKKSIYFPHIDTLISKYKDFFYSIVAFLHFASLGTNLTSETSFTLAFTHNLHLLDFQIEITFTLRLTRRLITS